MLMCIQCGDISGVCRWDENCVLLWYVFSKRSDGVTGEGEAAVTQTQERCTIVWAGGQTSSAYVHPSEPGSAQQTGTSADVREGCRMTNEQKHTYETHTHTHTSPYTCMERCNSAYIHTLWGKRASVLAWVLPNTFFLLLSHTRS